MTTPSPHNPVSGYKRSRGNRRSVWLQDKLAQWLITLGGISVVLAFLGIVIFIASVTAPLFQAAKIGTVQSVTVTEAEPNRLVSAEIVTHGLDDDLYALWTLGSMGRANFFSLADGRLLASQSLSEKSITAMSIKNAGSFAIGHDDGTVQLGRVWPQVTWGDAADPRVTAWAMSEPHVLDDAVAVKQSASLLRLTKLGVTVSEPLQIKTGSGRITHLSHIAGEESDALLVRRDDGSLVLATTSRKANLMTGKVTTRLSQKSLPKPPGMYESQSPFAILLGQPNRNAYVVFADGYCVRYALDKPEPAIAEVVNLLPSAQRHLSSVRMLLGNVTMIVADDIGNIAGWFEARPPSGKTFDTPDGMKLVKAHELASQSANVTHIAISSRDRQFLTADASGEVVLRHMTSATVQGKLKLVGAPQSLSLTEKGNAISAIDSRGELQYATLSNPHADGAVAELFLPVHYEGYADAQHIWQSSAGSDDAEPKHGMIPLIFGTLKATFYAMLFAVPIAIAAAIHTSEFMSPRLRQVVKPSVELMAGLPSVVLGFFAGLVVAPFLEDKLAALLLVCGAVPLSVVVGGMIWQTLPPHITRSTPRSMVFGFIIATCLLGLTIAWLLSPALEHVLFKGDLRGYLEGRIWRDNLLGGTPGLFVLLLAPVIVGCNIALHRYAWPRLRYGRTDNRMQAGLFELAKLLGLLLVSVIVAMLVSMLAALIGFDIRDSVPGLGGPIAGPYVQRNTLIIGMIMGFAIIPLIYTVSEDALSSVPQTLRSAALGAGATPWQTAIRVVLPVAMSGIFSACMIGFGRAAGETMIVLMAGGNTATLDPSLFSGVRSLSANIAVEMPEAPKNSTHFRILFLSALVLFVLTFVVNTAAELIRQRFRKRAYQL